MAKILFIYPNTEGYPMIPLGISTLSSILKLHKHEVDLFDTTFMLGNFEDLKSRENLNIVQKVDTSEFWGRDERKNVKKELLTKINDFHPDIIGFSMIENNYHYAKILFAEIKQNFDIPIIVGGVFPTIGTKYFLEDENVDIICYGEGEQALIELMQKIENNEKISDIQNLIIKKNNEVQSDNTRKFYNLENYCFPDWEIFDVRHLMKPFMGKMWKIGNFGTSRGCSHKCSYCINHLYQKKFKNAGKYYREKPLDLVIQEILNMKNRYSLELILFYDENFCIMKNNRFKEFCKEYKKQIDLPFLIQTCADTLLREERIRMLKDAGCVTITMGIEAGNEEIRRKILNKNISNDVYIRAFKNCRKYGIRTTGNVMLGLPNETEENIIETINFCKQCNPDSIGIAIFVPFYGTKLREMCIREGLMDDKLYDTISYHNSSILKSPNITKERFNELYYNFQNMVFDSKKGETNK